MKISPFGAIRTMGSGLGKRMIKGYMNKRMGMLTEEEAIDMHSYLH